MRSISIKFAKSSPLAFFQTIFDEMSKNLIYSPKNEKFWDLNERRDDFEKIEGREIRSDSNGTALISQDFS